MIYHCCVDIKLGGWSHLLMLKMLKVSSRFQGSSKVNGLPLLHRHVTWWMESSLLMLTNLKVISMSPGSSKVKWLIIVVKTW